jgi:uncharacterized protein with von Willebrand factor type A (vWA) domain
MSRTATFDSDWYEQDRLRALKEEREKLGEMTLERFLDELQQLPVRAFNEPDGETLAQIVSRAAWAIAEETTK